MNAAEIKRSIERYASKHFAGGFAAPMVGDIEKAIEEDRVHIWEKKGEPMYVGYEVRSARSSYRRDFTGNNYPIDADARFLQHFVPVGGGAIPDLREFDYVQVYQEDRNVVKALRSQSFGRQAVRITASSEIIGIYKRDTEDQMYPSYDEATLSLCALKVSEKQQAAITKEVEKIEGWRDDYPYYNKDGSWAQVSLRGYKPDDPFYGVKPSEMSKAWKEEHPDEAALTECDWTVITKKMPATMDLLRSVPWWSDFERIRLLQMYSKSGSEGKLLRHTDITDRDAGTRDGQISRFHLPIMSHPGARTYGWDLEGEEIVKNLKPWKLYYLDQRKPHMVTVPAGVNRIHLVPDVITNQVVRGKIK